MKIVTGAKKVRNLVLQRQIILLSIYTFIELKYIVTHNIKFIPCIMEKSFHPTAWLDFIVNDHRHIDFSEEDKFDDSFNELIQIMYYIEKELGIKSSKV